MKQADFWLVVLRVTSITDPVCLFVSPSVCVRPIHDEITPSYDNNTVRYIHISEAPDEYSMGVFVFPPHTKIPLHDHPGMCVLSRVLYGDLTRTSLDLARDQSQSPERENIEKNSSWFPWSTKGRRPKMPWGTKLAYRNRVDHLQAPECTVLYPFEGNLHEFVAGPHGAAVLDVLLPPYDQDHHRDCTFYEIKECSPLERQDTSRDPVWIVPIKQPEDFHCLSGSYKELGSSS